jgi:hypothetical protein
VLQTCLAPGGHVDEKEADRLAQFPSSPSLSVARSVRRRTVVDPGRVRNTVSDLTVGQKVTACITPTDQTTPPFALFRHRQARSILPSPIAPTDGARSAAWKRDTPAGSSRSSRTTRSSPRGSQDVADGRRRGPVSIRMLPPFTRQARRVARRGHRRSRRRVAGIRTCRKHRLSPGFPGTGGGGRSVLGRRSSAPGSVVRLAVTGCCRCARPRRLA